MSVLKDEVLLITDDMRSLGNKRNRNNNEVL